MIGDGDVAAIMGSGDFDEEAVFNGSITVRGWFTDESDATNLYGQVDIEAQKPSMIFNTDDLGSVTNRMSVVVRSRTFTVERIEKNGTGLSVVWLKT
jgi:hypothetical protein